MIGNFIIDAIKSKIFGSKDYFERVKSRLLRSLIAPLFLIVGTPTILLSVLSNIQFAEISIQGSIIRFLGSASSDLLILSVSVIVTLLAALSSNLYYSLHNTRVLKELKELEELQDREKTYKTLVDKVNNLISLGDNDKAIQLGGYIVKQYSNEVNRNPELILALIDLPGSNELILNSTLKHKQLTHKEEEVV